MIVVSDTGPLHYLLLIRRDHLLPSLFGTVAIPQAVIDELTDSGAPPLIRQSASALPDWTVKLNPSKQLATDDGRGKGERASHRTRQGVECAFTLRR